MYPALVSYIDMFLRNSDEVIDKMLIGKQIDINNMKDDIKRDKLIEYYHRMDNILCFELLITINFNENDSVKKKTRRAGRMYDVRNKKK